MDHASIPGRGGNLNRGISKTGPRLWFEMGYKPFPDDSRVLFAIRGILNEGVDQTRALLLTREYLPDLTRLVAADRERTFTCLAQPVGRPQRLQGFQAYPLPKSNPDQVKGGTFDDAKRLEAGANPWPVTMVQDAGPEAGKEPVGPAWFDRGIGAGSR